MARIYVSSTFSDLEEHRKKVNAALRRLGHEDVAMEYYVAGNERPLDRCLSDVASCDVYVGIFAYRYGYIPPQNNPEGRSITELEYQKARDERIPCLIFLLSDEALWPRSKHEKGAAAERIEGFRQELLERHSVNLFQNDDDLARKVNEAVAAWERETGRTGKRHLIDWEAYRQAVYDKHQWVRLQVIAGVSTQRGVAKIPLTEVFEPQLAAQGASWTDVPDEVRIYQKAIYGSARPEALEEGTPGETQEPESPEIAVDPETKEPLLVSNPELVLDMLGRESSQVILGGPGSGKSTILQYAMLRVCQAGVARDELPMHLQNAPVPFLIDLRNYVLRQAQDFVSYIVSHTKEFYDAAIDPESLADLLGQERQALVFFDGLDEVFDPDERRRVINQFQTFAHRYRETCIVVTSRIAGYDRTALGLAGFEHYTLLPLTLGQIRHFADQWYRYYTLEGTERTAQGLVQRIVENPRLLDLAGNPLLLTMMAVIYKDRDLPNERWRLYERCAETLLENWELGKGFKNQDYKLAVNIKTTQKSEILQLVSMYMLEHGQKDKELNAIAYTPLLNIMAGYLEEKYQRPRGDAEAIAEDILRHLMERTYVLAGIGERVFGFVHRTFMEYFAACRCQAQFNARKSDFDWLTRDIFGKHWHTDEWEEVLLLLIAMLHDQGTPIWDVVEYVRSRTEVPFNVAFAARCLGEAGDVQDTSHAQGLLVELAQLIAKYVAHRRMSRTNERFVETALKAFAALAPLVTATAEVQEALNHLNQVHSTAARMAVWQMGFALRLRKERLSYALTALHDEDEMVRRGAVLALEREWPGRADLVPALIEILRSDRNSRVRQAALAAMDRSWRHAPEILDAITYHTDEERSHTHVKWLIEYLAKTWRGNPKAFDVVLKLADRKPKAGLDYDYVVVGVAAFRALANGWRSDPRALSYLKGRAVQAEQPQNFAAATRAAALWALADGWRGETEVEAFLKDQATNHPDPETRATVLQALVGGEAEAQTFLKERAVNDPDPKTRAAVLWALAGAAVLWAKAEALAFLKERAVNDPDPKTRAAALRALAGSAGRWGGGETKSLAFLKERAVNDPDPEIRAAKLWDLIKVSWQAEWRTFLKERAVNDPDPKTRVAALWTVAHGLFDEAEARTFIQDQAVSHPNPETRAAALRALAGRWGGGETESLAFLKDRAASHPNPGNRANALWTIAEKWRGEAEVQTFLKERAMNDPDNQHARPTALRALANWWYGEALAFIQDLAASHPDPTIRAATIRVIMERYHTAEKFAFLKERAVNDPDLVIYSIISGGTPFSWPWSLRPWGLAPWGFA